MFGLANLFAPKKKSSPRRNGFRPRLECLERREVMSTASASLHAVTDTFGDNVAVFLQSTGGQPARLISSINRLGNGGPENSVIPTGVAGTPGGVQSFSEGLDANGRAEVFVKALDGSFWRYDGGWARIQTPGNVQVESFAAVKGGRVYAEFQNGSLDVYRGGAWFHVYGAGAVTALDAVTDKFGDDAVFVENADKSFGEFSSRPGQVVVAPPPGQAFVGTYTQLASTGVIPGVLGHSSPQTYSQVRGFSAGTDANGYADVFATWYNRNLDKYQLGSGWTLVAAAGKFESYSATDSGVAWIIGANGSLERYNGRVTRPVFDSGGPERSVAAASSLTAFITFPNNEIEGLFLDPNPNNSPQAWGIGTTPH